MIFLSMMMMMIDRKFVAGQAFPINSGIALLADAAAETVNLFGKHVSTSALSGCRGIDIHHHRRSFKMRLNNLFNLITHILGLPTIFVMIISIQSIYIAEDQN